MATLSEYEKQQQAKMQQVQNNYTTQRNQQATDYYKQVASGVDAQLKNQTTQINQQKDALPEQYRPQYDTSAIQELVDRRLATEGAANLNLTNSGYARNQQTSAGVMRQNRDASIRSQQQAASDELTKRIQQLISDAELQKQQYKTQTQQQAASDILNNYSSLQNTAYTNAANLYNTDVTNATARDNIAKQIEAEKTKLAQQSQQQESQRKQDLYISLISKNTPTREAYIHVYGTDAERAALAYEKIWGSMQNEVKGMSVEEARNKSTEASLQAIQQVYGTGQAALIKAFRDMGG